MGVNPNAIVAQEAEGQHELVNSDVLPTEISADGRITLERAGVKFGELVPGDPIFQHVELPQGWKKQPTDHSMWSDLVDEKGRKRGAIFYKAAFYDRLASMSTVSRFSIHQDYKRGREEGVAVACVTDGDKVIYSTQPVQLLEKAGEDAVNKAALLGALSLGAK